MTAFLEERQCTFCNGQNVVDKNILPLLQQNVFLHTRVLNPSFFLWFITEGKGNSLFSFCLYFASLA